MITFLQYMYVSLYHYMVHFKIIQNYMSITSQSIFEIKVITHIHTKHLAYTYRYISMHTSMLDRFPYNRVIYTHTSHNTRVHTTHTYHIQSTQTTQTPHIQSSDIQQHTNTHMPQSEHPHHLNALHTHTHTHTHTQALLLRSVTWVLPPKQTKCVSPAMASMHEFFTSWAEGWQGQGD